MVETGAITLGVVADTHIPDRSPGLHPVLLERFAAAQVSAILHAGDVSVPAVLSKLAEIAPVYAVRGNRDIFALRHLPTQLELTFGEVTIGLVHGHGSLRNYLWDRLRYHLVGLREGVYRTRALQSLTGNRVVIFGHTHLPVNQWVNGHLLFNPGSTCCPHLRSAQPSAGLLYISSDGEVVGEIFNFIPPPNLPQIPKTGI